MIENKSVISRVRKRDGRIVLFDQERITNAIFKAAQAVGGTDKELSKKLSDQVVRVLEERFGTDIIPTVEQIQDLVEKILIENGHVKTSKAFILYREQRRKLREMTVLMEPIGLVEGYIRQNDWKVNENSNMTYSLQGLNSHISNAIISKYWLEKLYTPRIREAYEKGDIHIHDLGTLGCYCVGWDLKDLLLSGFKGVSGKVESKPPKHFRTALGQAVNFFYTLQGEAAGAMAFSNFDTLLAPFIAYDKLTSAEIKQALQEFIFNMNVPTRVGFQSPFSNITLDLKVPDFMKEENVIIGGKLMNKKYKHFQREVDLFNEILAEVILEGDASGRVFTFPIPTYNITKDFEWDNNAYDNIWEMTAKYGVPYFSNFINSDMKPEDARSMCCRLKLDQRELRKRGGGLFGSNPLTGSLGVVTINMARIGYFSKTEEEFFERLSNLMDLSKESLEIKRKVLEDFTEQNLYPYSKFYLRNMKASTGLYWKNHFSTIGLLGMNEALLNFMQKDIASEEGRKFAIKVLDFMRKKISEYQQEIGNIYNLEATPGEGSLAPEEKVLISSSDPRLTEIGPLIDGFLEKNRDRIHKIEDTEILPLKQGTLYTYGFSRKTNKIKKYPVTSVIRHKGRSMYEIKTRLGKKVKVTGQHSVFTLNKQGDIEQIKVDKLRQGSYIAVPKRINIQPVNTKFNLIERFKSSPLKNRFYLKTSKEFIEALVNRKQIKDWTRKYYKTEYRTIKSTWKKRCVIPLRLIYDNNIKLNLKVLQKSKIIYRSTKSTKPINAQIRINHDLGFVLGGLLSEGWLGKRPSFYNTNEEYVKKFTQACDTIFGEGSYSLCLKKREKEGRKPMYTVTLSKVTGLVLKDVMQLKGLSGEKSVPSFVYASKDETIKGLLKAFTLGDGTFYSKESKGNYNIRLYTKSKDLVNGLNLLLLRLGIVAKLKKDNKSKTNPNWADGYVLEISGVEYLKKYFKLILGKKFNKKITNSGKETVPEMPKIIKNILKKHKIKLKEVGIDKDSFNRNVRKNSISVHYLKRIITQISSKLKNAEIESLKRIVDSDIFWDKITSIEKVSTPKYVYDFEVNVNGDTVENFLGGDCLICLHNTTYRFAKKDKEIYPDIIVANEKAYQERKAAPFYTNSTQLHVDYTDDIFEALMLQDEIQTKYNGGTVIHCFLGEKISSVEATKALVRKIAENFKIPYFTLTPTFSICPKHGYLVGEHEYCPKCDEEIGYKEVK